MQVLLKGFDFMPCKRYYEALRKGEVQENYCPMLKGALCLHLKVEYFPTLECQRAYIQCETERSPEILQQELQDLKSKRVIVWGD